MDPKIKGSAKIFCAPYVDPGEYEPSQLCGSLAKHEGHLWAGQTTGKTLLCPGHDPEPEWKQLGEFEEVS